MFEIASIVIAFGIAWGFNVILKSLGFKPRPNPYFGDYDEYFESLEQENNSND